MAKSKVKVVEIPSWSSVKEIEKIIDEFLDKGFYLQLIFTLGTKTYATLIKDLTK